MRSGLGGEMYVTRAYMIAWRCMRAVGLGLLMLAPLTSAAAPATPAERGFRSVAKASIPAPSAEPETKTERSTLRITVVPPVADAHLLPEWISQRSKGLIDRLDRLSNASEHEQWIAVEISGATYTYQVAIAAMRDGAPINNGSAQFSCDCNSEMLLERADWWIARAAELLWEDSVHMAAAGRTRPTGLAGLDGEPQAGQQCTTEGPRGRQRPARYVGLGVGLLGAGALATGIALYVREPDVRPNGLENDALDIRTTTTPGITLAIGGGMALAAGVTLFLFDTLQHRRSRLGLTPAASRKFTGASIHGRF